jgi:hypothetical protein
MKIRDMHAAKAPKIGRKSAILGIGLVLALSFGGLQAQGQTKKTETYERPRETESRPTYTPPPTQPSRPAYTPSAPSTPSSPAHPTYAPGQPSHPTYAPNNTSTPGHQPRSTYTPAPSQSTHPAMVYTPHTSGNSGNGYSGNSATASKPSTSGPTVYTPHAGSSAVSASGGTGADSPSHVNGTTVYTPRGRTADDAASTTKAVTTTRSGRTVSVASSVSAATPIHAAYSVPSASSIASETPGQASVLTPTGSQRVVSQVNTTRATFSGINKRALPAGQVTVQPSGRLAIAASGGRQYGLRSDGTLASFRNTRGTSAGFAPNGRFRSLQTANMKVQYGPHGGRTVVKQLSNHETLVSYGPHNGYVERTIVHGQATLMQRTYVVPRADYFTPNTTYVRTYGSYSYRGVTLVSYTPGVYYPPAFYGWASNPWATPVAYTWGWTGDPWVDFYSGYFAPSPMYQSPMQWMADYILSSSLATAYREQQDFQPEGDSDAAANDADANETTAGDGQSDNEVYAQTSTPITPQLRAAIAEEARQNLAAENAAASNQGISDSPQSEPQPLSETLQPNHVFVVSTLLNVYSDQGNCALTAGDIISLVNATGSYADTPLLTVASGKRGDCPAGAQVQVVLQDLQEMDNNLRVQMDNAIAKLHSDQGQGGLPAAPQSAIASPPRQAIDGATATPEPGVSAMLDQEQQQASLAETGVVQAAFASNGGGDKTQASKGPAQ